MNEFPFRLCYDVWKWNPDNFIIRFYNREQARKYAKKHGLEFVERRLYY